MSDELIVPKPGRGVALAALLSLLTGCLSSGPPTMPLTSGAEAVVVTDTKRIKEHPVDMGQCKALGQRTVGPVANNNLNVALQNETFAAGGDLFFGTGWSINGDMWTVTGMAYRCKP